MAPKRAEAFPQSIALAASSLEPFAIIFCEEIVQLTSLVSNIVPGKYETMSALQIVLLPFSLVRPKRAKFPANEHPKSQTSDGPHECATISEKQHPT